jgi:hypothetical protein
MVITTARPNGVTATAGRHAAITGAAAGRSPGQCRLSRRRSHAMPPMVPYRLLRIASSPQRIENPVGPLGDRLAARPLMLGMLNAAAFSARQDGQLLPLIPTQAVGATAAALTARRFTPDPRPGNSALTFTSAVAQSWHPDKDQLARCSLLARFLQRGYLVWGK